MFALIGPKNAALPEQQRLKLQYRFLFIEP